MKYETRMDRVNKYRDEKRIRDICEKLNNIVNKITGINPNFTYWGTKEDGYYNIVNRNKYENNIRIDLNFKLYYPDKNYFIDGDGLDDEEFNEYIEYKYNKSKLLYADISWFSVEPKGKGIGSKIIKELVEVLKYIDSIECIVLHPEGNDAENFWIKNNFVNRKDLMYSDERVKTRMCKELIYIY